MTSEASLKDDAMMRLLVSYEFDFEIVLFATKFQICIHSDCISETLH